MVVELWPAEVQKAEFIYEKKMAARVLVWLLTLLARKPKFPIGDN